ncbi:hypothetical protein FSARC_12167 [Fusarium sarcochroum]|uniref:Uncharacterized protein n=1 Tax=Fusarium sarcochroum TaxID=1208366 RepID=A0A8H4WXD1_9HYPO|nr:hypothetical protein FSARC_12167 [Fusarium sarcochroum]
MENHQSFADQVSEITENIVELMVMADSRGPIPGWPLPSMIQALRSSFHDWIQSSGAFLPPLSPHSIEYRFREDQYRCSMIREDLLTLNRQVLALLVHYDERPDVQEPAAVQGIAMQVGQSLGRLSNWTDQSISISLPIPMAINQFSTIQGLQDAMNARVTPDPPRFVTSNDTVVIGPLARNIHKAFDRILVHPNMKPEECNGSPFIDLIGNQKQLFRYWVDNYTSVPAGTLLPCPRHLQLHLRSIFQIIKAPVCLEDILGAVDDFCTNMDAYGLKLPSAQRKCMYKAEYISVLIKDMYINGESLAFFARASS